MINLFNPSVIIYIKGNILFCKKSFLASAILLNVDPFTYPIILLSTLNIRHNVKKSCSCPCIKSKSTIDCDKLCQSILCPTIQTLPRFLAPPNLSKYFCSIFSVVTGSIVSSLPLDKIPIAPKFCIKEQDAS